MVRLPYLWAYQIRKTHNIMTYLPTTELTIDEKAAALKAAGYFIGGLSDEGIAHYYSIEFFEY